MSLSTVLADVFDRRQTLDADLELGRELELIALAQLGDPDAVAELIRAYAPLLRSQVARHASTLERDDAIAAALEAFTVALHDAVPGSRLAAVLPLALRKCLGEASSAARVDMAVPTRTLQRFFSILRLADGDVELAAQTAPRYKMTPETFAEVLTAVRSVDRLEAAAPTGRDQADDPTREGLSSIAHSKPIWTGSAPDAELSDLIELAFAAVNPLEAEVIRLAYGFTDYDPVPDAEIGFRLGVNRVTAWRYRTRGLDKMRAALAADAEAMAAV